MKKTSIMHSLMHSKWLASAPILLALTLAIVLGYAEAQRNLNNGTYFSAQSLQGMRSLNFENNIMMDDLLSDVDSPVMTELFKADALTSTQEVDKSNRGLVATLDNGEDGGSVLLLQPGKEMSDLELAELADKYESAVPEFKTVEIDQDVELEGYPIFEKTWSDVGEVDLASEEEPLSPIVVAVIDSGIDTGHEIFEGHKILTGWNTVDESTEMYDDVGHGTHIAGIIATEMPGAAIEPYKIVGANGGRLSNVIEAFQKAIDDGVDIINCSFGLTSPSYALEKLVEKAYSNGTVIVAAAGNNNNSDGFYPATYEHTIAVASVDDIGRKMDKSNYGDWIDVAAYGYRIRSALPGNLYGYKSGTSQATAFVSAEVARLMAAAGLENHLSYEDVLSELVGEGSEIKLGILAGVSIVK